MRPFDALELPLSGTHLVEAGAGTGKTYGITALYVRLVVEGRRSPREIAVVTFTDAATRELRGRVRDRLAKLVRRIGGGPDTGDREVEALAARIAHDDEARRRIELALHELDDAMIATIHGFCRRVLQDFALDASQPFATLEPGDGTALRERAVRDAWRALVVGGDAATADWALTWLAGPESLAQWLEQALRVAPDRVEPLVGDGEVGRAAAALDAARRAAPIVELDALHDELAACKALSRAKGNPHAYEALEAGRGEIAQWLVGDRPAHLDAPLAALSALTTASVDEHCLARQRGWRPAATAATAWVDAAYPLALEHARLRRCAFLAAALGLVRASVAAAKRTERVVSFDDLVTGLAHVVETMPEVVRAIRKRYAVALVDEFQDTDAEQYRIFRAVFHDREDGALYLVGDPKQAIYRFRGGDVFAYAAARHDARSEWTLDANRRSDARLVSAVNALFARPDAFGHAFIAFRPAYAAPRANDAPLLPPVESPLVAWTLPDLVRPIAKGELADRLHDAVAATVASLLAVHRGGRRPTIAVLVRKNREVADAVDALARAGIAANSASTHGVFDTDEARELETVLAALADAGDTGLARAALATELLGRDAAALRRTVDDADALDGALRELARLRELALADGPAALARALAQRAGPGWLARHDGPRRMANLAHLGELLQAAARTQRGLAAQRAWLARRIASAAIVSPDAELRPEATDAPVEVSTVHRSKGLEWDIVFAPFLWDSQREDDGDDPHRFERRRPVEFHEETGGLRVDLGSPAWEERHARRNEECRAEAVRLAYVAMTRARHRAYTFWGLANGARDSALARLLHADAPVDANGIATALEAWRARSDGAVEIATLPSAQPGVAPAPEDGTAPSLAARPFLGSIDRRWRLLSYSALFAGEDAARPDHDAAAPALPVVFEGEVPSRPRGARFGECVHAVLERHDFGAEADAPANLALLAERCREFGYAGPDAAYVGVLVNEARRAEIVPGVPLAGLSTRRAELEFFFPLEQVRLDEVARALALDPRYARDDAAFARVATSWHGLMHGYVDLVFGHDGRYGLIDYKSNWLGPRHEDYAPAALAHAVRASDYDLQYLIYTVALVRHLRARLGAAFDYSRDYAGVAYLFLRGLPGGQGIHRDTPPRAVVEALDRAFGARP